MIARHRSVENHFSVDLAFGADDAALPEQVASGESGAQRDLRELGMIAKKANISIPAQIAALFDKEIAQKTVIDKQDIEKEILGFLGA